MRIHTGERPFTCPWKTCKMKFRRSDERKRHFRKHTGEKPYHCPYCARSFSRSDHRNSHVKKIHNYKLSVVFTRLEGVRRKVMPSFQHPSPLHWYITLSYFYSSGIFSPNLVHVSCFYVTFLLVGTLWYICIYYFCIYYFWKVGPR